MKKVLITACGNKKEDKPMEAAKLYKSSRIRHLYKKSKELDIPFFILSAKYGLVSGDDVIEPYNEIMDKSKCKILEDQISQTLKYFDFIIYYKGGARREYYNCIEKVAKKLNKKLITFGYGNMGDIGKLKKIIDKLKETDSNV
jgi:hypothetical protein